MSSDASAEDIASEVAAMPFWFHSIDVGHGVVTPGMKPADLLVREVAQLQLPPLAGKSVLDIGAWDGYFSFATEELGAERVVALDHFVWSIDRHAIPKMKAEREAKGLPPRPTSETEVWRPDTMPGKATFDLARRLRGSKVESIAADFMTMDLGEVGTFDVVLYLGVLYHIEDPYGALKRLARVTGGEAYIETAGVAVNRYEHRKLWEFYEADEFNGDPTNWWAPNLAALQGACRAAGFSDVQTLVGPPDVSSEGDVFWCRLVVRAIK
jgi:tRNA (mo5U34)-methyltransferase